VHTGDHHDALIEDALVQTVRKSRQEDAARIAMKDGVSLRVFLDRCHGDIDRATECIAQPRTLRLVPFESISNVGFSLRREKSRLHRDLRRSRTSDHGLPSGLPARTSSSSASRRRSNSDR
jgi:hypothetical protein